ncbi:MAG: hypothetical protein LBO69_02170, partial [Ignavibacteria bacterium]|nr:hypothetical protein [Ignavibacteria bacterium]
MKNIILLIAFWGFAVAGQAQIRYELPCDKRLFDSSLDTLKGLVGTQEATNNNDGAKINEIQLICGIPIGSAYCNATQYYAFFVSAKELKMDTMNLPIPRNGLAQSSFNYAKKQGVKTEYKAQVG